MTANYQQGVADHVIDLLDQDGRPIALMEVIPKPSHRDAQHLSMSIDFSG